MLTEWSINKENDRMKLQLSNAIQGLSIKCEFLSSLYSGSSIKHESIIQRKSLQCDEGNLFSFQAHTCVRVTEIKHSTT